MMTLLKLSIRVLWVSLMLQAMMFISSGCSTNKPVAVEIAWHESYEEAVEEAQRTGKPILADFTGSDWCSWCSRLQEEVFNTHEFTAWSNENVVRLKIDFPHSKSQSAQIRHQNVTLQRRYSITGFPTILFLNAEGQVIGQTGYVEGGPAGWIAEAESILSG